jgi:hypothetical protein
MGKQHQIPAEVHCLYDRALELLALKRFNHISVCVEQKELITGVVLK